MDKDGNEFQKGNFQGQALCNEIIGPTEESLKLEPCIL